MKYKKPILQFSFLAGISFVLFSLHSCKKDNKNSDSESNDHSIPVIALTSPADNGNFQFGDTVKIKGTITDNSLHEATLTITNDTTGATIWSFAPTVHDLTSYTIDTFYVSFTNKVTKATLTAQAVDHNNNSTSANRKMTLNP